MVGTANAHPGAGAFTICAARDGRRAGTLTRGSKQVAQGALVSLAANVSNTGIRVITGLPITCDG